MLAMRTQVHNWGAFASGKGLTATPLDFLRAVCEIQTAPFLQVVAQTIETVPASVSASLCNIVLSNQLPRFYRVPEDIDSDPIVARSVHCLFNSELQVRK